MPSLMFLGFSSLMLALLFTPLVRYAAGKLGMLDIPDQQRKLHARPVPRLGGIAILASYLMACVLLMTFPFTGGALVWAALPFVWKILPAAGLALLTGILDDTFGLKPWQKLGGQLSAALAAYAGGIHIDALGLFGKGVVAGQWHWWSLPITVLWLLACMNALNLIDGLDGLAAGIGFFGAATILVAALVQRNLGLALATMPLVGALLGFLWFNFAPASIFLGDCGSLLIGLLLGAFAVVWSEKSATIIGMAAPLMALSVPLLDTVLAIARRFLRRRPIFSADRGHVHHRLLDLGLSPREVALLLYAVCAVSAALSLRLTNHGDELVLIVIFCAVSWFGIRQLHFIEFDTAGKMLVEGSFQDLINSRISVEQIAAELVRAHTPDDCWSVIKQCYRGFGFGEVEMLLRGRRYRECSAPVEAAAGWLFEIALSHTEFIRFRACPGGACEAHTLARLAEVVRQEFDAKQASFAALGFPFCSELQATDDLISISRALGRSVAPELSAELVSEWSLVASHGRLQKPFEQSQKSLSDRHRS